MKVTKSSKFEPITIVLETEEEAIAMWHRLNVQPDVIITNSNRTDYVFSKAAISTTARGMWDSFTKVFYVGER